MPGQGLYQISEGDQGISYDLFVKQENLSSAYSIDSSCGARRSEIASKPLDGNLLDTHGNQKVTFSLLPQELLESLPENSSNNSVSYVNPHRTCDTGTVIALISYRTELHLV